MNSPRPQQRHEQRYGGDAGNSSRRTASALYQSLDTSPAGAARHGSARAEFVDQQPTAPGTDSNYLPNWSFSRLDAPRDAPKEDAPRAAGTRADPAPHASASDFGATGGSTGTSHNNTSSMAPHPSSAGGRARQQLPWMEDSQRVQDIFQAAAAAAASVVSIPTVTPTAAHLHNASAVSIPTEAGTGTGSFAIMNTRNIAAPLDSDSEYEPQTLDDRSIGERLQGMRSNCLRRHPALHPPQLADTDTVTMERGSEAVSNYNTANYNTAADALTDDGSDDQDNSIATLGKISQNYSIS